MNSNMNKFVLATIFVCFHVMSNNINWGSCKVDKTNDADSMPVFDHLHESEIPNLNNSDIILKDKCMQNTNQNYTYGNITLAKKNFSICVHSLVNIKELEAEIYESKSNGDVDVIFKKYCSKSSELKNCVLNLTTTINKCLDDSEKETVTIVTDITDALLSFMCQDQSPLINSEDGIDCFVSNQIAINDCLNNSTFINYINNNENKTGFVFKFEKEQCMSFSDLQQCVVKVLQKCKEPTTGDFVESLFKLVVRSTPCLKLMNGSGILRPTTHLAALCVLSVFLIRIWPLAG